MKGFFSTLSKRVTQLLSTEPSVQYTVCDAELQRKLHTLLAALQKNQRKTKEANSLLADILKQLCEVRG